MIIKIRLVSYLHWCHSQSSIIESPSHRWKALRQKPLSYHSRNHPQITASTNLLPQLAGNTYSEHHHFSPVVEKETADERIRGPLPGVHALRVRWQALWRQPRSWMVPPLQLLSGYPHLKSYSSIPPSPSGGQSSLQGPLFPILSVLQLQRFPWPHLRDFHSIFIFHSCSGIISKTLLPDPSVLSKQELSRTDNNAPRHGDTNMFHLHYSTTNYRNVVNSLKQIL